MIKDRGQDMNLESASVAQLEQYKVKAKDLYMSYKSGGEKYMRVVNLINRAIIKKGARPL